VLARGTLRKMESKLGPPIAYTLPLGDERVELAPLLGRTLRLEWEGRVQCVHCGRNTRKSFGQGYCYPCFTSLARCDRCVVQPELCHYAMGTCREPDWGEKHCLIPHTVYLANSSGLKVGITRGLDPTTRWIDQGAAQAVAIRTGTSRLEAGQIEVAFKPHVADKTNWRAMLRGEPPHVDLLAESERLHAEIEGSQADAPLPGERAIDPIALDLKYPVLEYPTKIVSHNLDKNPLLEGTLLGIKGQYLILDSAVINVRKYTGYLIRAAA